MGSVMSQWGYWVSMGSVGSQWGQWGLDGVSVGSQWGQWGLNGVHGVSMGSQWGQWGQWGLNGVIGVLMGLLGSRSGTDRPDEGGDEAIPAEHPDPIQPVLRRQRLQRGPITTAP